MLVTPEVNAVPKSGCSDTLTERLIWIIDIHQLLPKKANSILVDQLFYLYYMYIFGIITNSDSWWCWSASNKCTSASFTVNWTRMIVRGRPTVCPWKNIRNHEKPTNSVRNNYRHTDKVQGLVIVLHVRNLSVIVRMDWCYQGHYLQALWSIILTEWLLYCFCLDSWWLFSVIASVLKSKGTPYMQSWSTKAWRWKFLFCKRHKSQSGQ